MSTRASDNSGRVKNFLCQSFEDRCCAWPHLTSCSPAHSRIHPRPSSLNVCLLPSSESATGPVYGKDSSTPEKAPWNFEAGSEGGSTSLSFASYLSRYLGLLSLSTSSNRSLIHFLALGPSSAASYRSLVSSIRVSWPCFCAPCPCLRPVQVHFTEVLILLVVVLQRLYISTPTQS